MSEEDIIKLWKEGFSIDQIVNRHPLKNILGKNDYVIRNRIEKIILKYQS